MNNPKQAPIAPSKQVFQLRKKIKQLEQRAADAEEALDAIRSGSVDALVVYTDQGEKIYTIQGAETTYRLMVESINEGAATMIEDGTILYCNRRFAEMISMPLESIIGTSILQYIPPEEKAIFSSLMERGLKERCRDEATFISKDAHPLPVMVSLNNFSANSVPGLCLIATDLAESKKVEEVIRQDALRSETLAEVTRSLVEASLDETAIMQIIVEAAVRLIGDACIIRVLSSDHQSFLPARHHHADPQVNQLLDEIIGAEALPASEGICGQVVKTGQVIHSPAINLKRPGQSIRKEFPGLAGQLNIYSLLAVPVRTHDTIIGSLVLLRLTRQKTFNLDDQHLASRLADHMAIAMTNAQLYNDLQTVLRTEQAMRLQLIQAEKLTALNRMMATVVHEINNPVQTIKNCLYLAETEAQPGSPQLGYLGMASSEINRITKLVSSLRDIYRQPKEMVPKVLELSRLLADVHLLLESHLQHHNVTWVQEQSTGHNQVSGISDHLKQVFLNISLNAIDAMQPAGGTLTISTTADNKLNEVAIKITDTGCGIDPEHLNRIFDPFYTTKDGGSGLGLSICYEIIQQHSGRISVESLPGRGATFTVVLPMAPTLEERAF